MDDSARVISAELGGDETLLWSGRPVQGLRLVLGDALMIPFSLLWGGFAIFWEVMVFHSGAPWFFRLWGVPFVCVGLYLIVGRFFADAWLRARTRYGVTNQRVLIVTQALRKRVVSLERRTLGPVELEERSDGTGGIVFRSGGLEDFYRGRRMPPKFEGIPDARRVYGLIRAAPAEPR